MVGSILVCVGLWPLMVGVISHRNCVPRVLDIRLNLRDNCPTRAKYVLVNYMQDYPADWKIMITLSAWDLVALTIALTSSLIVVITTAVANHRLTESVHYWRDAYLQAEQDLSKSGM